MLKQELKLRWICSNEKNRDFHSFQMKANQSSYIHSRPLKTNERFSIIQNKKGIILNESKSEISNHSSGGIVK